MENHNEYIQEVNDIFELALEDINYNECTTTTKKYFDVDIEKMRQSAIEYTEKYLEEFGTMGIAETMTNIQAGLTVVLAVVSAVDIKTKDRIWELNPNSINDSKLALGFDMN